MRRANSVNKTRHIDIRFSQDDYEKIRKQAEGNLSAFCRKKILQDTCQEKDKNLREIAYQVRKIGVNINQVTARINAGIPFPNDAQRLQEELEKVYQLLCGIEEK